jgi:metal-responsive CopG/Arc/MetJ family transcriptional regulator
MSFARINVSFPEELLQELSRAVEARKRSRFIAEAVARALKEQREQRLAAEYRQAASEMRRINRDLEGVTADGLD